MNASEWLTAKAPGFEQLSPEELAAIHEFSLIWMFFEARVLNGWSSAQAIETALDSLAQHVSIPVAQFEPALNYFRDRYLPEGNPNYRFDALNWRQNDGRAHVEAVLGGNMHDARDVLLALLLIVYRLRNNLFHGEKWAYGINDQRGNFTQVTTVLTNTLDRFGKAGLI